MKLLLALTLSTILSAQTGRPTMHHATGPFDVKTAPLTLPAPALQTGRMSLAKHYHGALEAAATGEMLTGGDFKTGSAGYVALETLTGTLDGKEGAFQLMHWGVMSNGNSDLRVEIVPGSGSGALAGITGEMKIAVAPDGKHTYDLSYTLPATNP